MAENQNEQNAELNNESDEALGTKDFVPVDTEKQSGGATKPFDTLGDKKKDGDGKKKEKRKKDKAKKEEKEQKPKKAAEDRAVRKSAKAAKNTVSGVWYVIRKVLMCLLNIILTVLIVGIITGAAVGVTFIIYIKNYVDPSFDQLNNLQFDSALSTKIHYGEESSADGTDDVYLKGSENRMWADIEDIPQMLIDAYIAVEDQRFYEHEGVDTTRTASAIYNFFIPTSDNYGGGSTITQQLIKNASGDNEATIQRKVQEIFRAYDVEKNFTKDEILEMYLNTIFLSHNAYGVRVAAETYFGKDLDELNLAECAAIASIGKSPTRYDPILNPQNNLERRNLVLKLMLEQGKITQEQFDEYYDAPIVLAQDREDTDDDSGSSSESIHSYYIDAVMDDVTYDLMEEYGYDYATANRVLYSGGLDIETCVDPALQAIAEKIYTDSSYWPENDGIQPPQSAICIMDPDTGDILAMVGGLGEKTEPRGFNRATHAYRQCGSSIKPVSVYALAIEEGLLNGGDTIDDVPQRYSKSSGSFWPSNAGRAYRGRVSFDYALQASLNTTAVATCNALGVEKVFENFKAYGYTTLVESLTRADGSVISDIGASPLALGGLTYGVTVRDHTQAYACLANGGVTSKARTYSVVRDRNGNIILDNREEHEVKYSESTTAVLTDLLTHVVNGPSGTARAHIKIDDNYGVQVAAKTGTTNDNVDVYFSGHTPDLVACVWYGYDNNLTVSDGSAATKMWEAVFNEIYAYYEEEGIEYTKEFYVPSSVVQDVEYCTVSGKIPTDACRNDLYHMQGGSSCIATGTFDIGTVPTEYCDSHVMVKWDTVTEALCLDGCICPAANLIEVGVRKMTLEERCLPGKARVGDAQYTYMELPEGIPVCLDPDLPFFYNAFPEDFEYAFGISTGETPHNRICSEHYVAPIEPVVPNTPSADPSGGDSSQAPTP